MSGRAGIAQLRLIIDQTLVLSNRGGIKHTLGKIYKINRAFTFVQDSINETFQSEAANRK